MVGLRRKGRDERRWIYLYADTDTPLRNLNVPNERTVSFLHMNELNQSR